MKAEHTQGPWEAIGCAVYVAGNPWCEVIPGIHNTRSAPSDERRANARLIAAAPELLEAAETLVNLATSDETMIDYAAAYDRLRAAIAKAKGDAS